MKYVYSVMIFYCGFLTSLIFASYSESVKYDKCREKLYKKYQKNKDIIYDFYGIPKQLRRTKIKIGYNHIAAYGDHKLQKCMEK